MSSRALACATGRPIMPIGRSTILCFLSLLWAFAGSGCQSGSDALRAKADEAYAGEAYTLALDGYSALLEMDSSQTEVRFFRGVCHQMLEAYPQAIADFERVVREDPEAYKAWLNMGHCHYALKDWLQAKDSYEKVLELKSDYGLALNPLSHMHFYLGDTASACATLERARSAMADRSVDPALRAACTGAE
jgi:tetratricopeptide (TPR) repeat protein